MLAGRRVPRLERYLLRGRFDVERRTSALSRAVRAPVVRATTSFSSKMEVASSPENRNPHAKKDKICAGYAVPRLGGHGDDASSRTGRPRELFGMPAARAGLPIDPVRPAARKLCGDSSSKSKRSDPAPA